MTIHIDCMTIRLPSGFELRGQSIAQHTAQALAQQGITLDGPVEQIRVTARDVSPATSDKEIARHISGKIGSACTRILP